MPVDYSKPIEKFKQQARQAKQRGIPWELTFDEWMGVWAASGKWTQRGKRAGQYVMARNGDVGPYSVGNVRICRLEENVSEAHANSRMPDRAGTGRGWTLRKSGARRYQVYLRDHYVGSFATQTEAEEAYQAAAMKFCPREPLNRSQIS